MTPNKSWFESSYKEISSLVYMRNNQTCKVYGIGTVRLNLQDGSDKLLEYVRHFLELIRNLVSLGMLDSAGYPFKGEGNV